MLTLIWERHHDDIEVIQFGMFVAWLLFTFSRAECPLPPLILIATGNVKMLDPLSLPVFAFVSRTLSRIRGSLRCCRAALLRGALSRDGGFLAWRARLAQLVAQDDLARAAWCRAGSPTP